VVQGTFSIAQSAFAAARRSFVHVVQASVRSIRCAAAAAVAVIRSPQGDVTTAAQLAAAVVARLLTCNRPPVERTSR